MSESDHTNTGDIAGPGLDPVLRRDVLISQIIDGEGDGSAWTEFTRLSQADPDAWRQLALLQRDHAMLRVGVAAQVDVADGVDLPDHVVGGGGAGGYRFSRWSGWAAAAALALTWLGTQVAMINQSRKAELGAGQGAGMVAGLSSGNNYRLDGPQDAISAYKQLGQRSGTVLGEMPERVIVESKPLAGGRGFEVVYLRQFMERAEVANLYQLTRDEGGQQGMLLPVSQPARRTERID